MTTTTKQLGVLRHALGLRHDGTGRAYRNHFVTGPGSDDYDACRACVDDGLMVERLGSPLTGGDPVFLVSNEGRAAAVARDLPVAALAECGTTKEPA